MVPIIGFRGCIGDNGKENGNDYIRVWGLGLRVILFGDTMVPIIE